METVNAFIGGLLAAVLSPFRDVTPLISLTVISAATAALTLLVVKFTSNQPRLASVKRALHACIYEVRLYGDDPRAVMRALVEMLRHNLTYLRLSLTPLLILALPFSVVLTHLDAYYGTGQLPPGTPALVKVQMKEAAGEAPRLVAPAGVRIETPAVWIPSLREAVWRISGETSGSFALTVTAGDAVVTKEFTTAAGIVRRSSERPSARLLDQLGHPGERPVPAGGVQSVTVTYPSNAILVFGWEIHWLVIFFVVAMVFALILRVPMKVVI